MTAATSPSILTAIRTRRGFVQVMQGRGSDPERARQLIAANPDEWAAFRPEVLGSVAVGYEDSGYTMDNRNSRCASGVIERHPPHRSSET